MTRTGRLRDQLYLAAVIALLLLTSQLSGYVTLAVAALLFAAGLVLYPQLRRTAIISASAAAVIAVLVVLLRSLF